MKISSKIVLTFAPLAVASLAMLGWLGYDTAKRALTAQAVESLRSLADLKQRRIEGIIDQNRERLALVASRTQLRLSLQRYLNEADTSHQRKITRILRDAQDTAPAFRKLIIQGPDGTVVAATDTTLVGDLHPWHRAFAEALDGPRVDLLFRKPDGTLGVYLAAPLVLQGTVLGILIIEADASNILESTTSYQGLGDTGESLLVRRDEQGNALFLTPARFDPDATLRRRIAADAEHSPYIAALDGPSGLMVDGRDYQGHQVLAAFRRIEGPGWGLVVQKRASEALAPVLLLRRWTLSLILLASVLVAIASLFLARSITRPIIQLTEVAGRISDGALRERAVVATVDEVRLLADAFNRMTSRLLDDIAERKRAEETLQALLRSAPDGILITTEQGQIVIANRRADDMLGLSGSDLVGTSMTQLIAERFREPYRAYRAQVANSDAAEEGGPVMELCVVTAAGEELPVEVSLASIDTLDGVFWVHAFRDITDRKRAEAKLVQQANFDNLTGLPSRLLAHDRLTQALARAHRTEQVVAVMFLDLDRFKNVNDTLGHSAGDQLLAHVAKRICACVRESDTVARLGGDEFLIILADLESLQDADVVAEQVLSGFAEPFRLGERDIYVSASIGITGYPMDTRQPEELLRNADAAMYRAKDEGRGTYRFYTAEMNAQLRSRLEMEEQLRFAIPNQELSLDFQPQLDLKNGGLLCAEALVRWNNPKLGAVPPAVFIPLAEETGLIHVIGEWVLRRACRDAVAWEAVLGHPLRVSVNISALQFKHGDLSATVRQALGDSGLSAEYLELELTERVLVEDNLNAKRALAELKQLGVRLALDDFGTGYSSLSYLKWFPCDVLKIDRAFVAGIAADEADAALCRAIIAMGGSLGMTVVAEGVETGDQLAFLSAHGADGAQGYFISRPVGAEQFAGLLSAPKDMLFLAGQ